MRSQTQATFDPIDMSNETCRAMIYRDWGRSKPCSRPAKGHLKNGTPACGIHLRAEREVDKREEERTERISKSRAFNDEVKAFAKKHNIESLMMIWDHRPFVKLNFYELKKLIEGVINAG